MLNLFKRLTSRGTVRDPRGQPPATSRVQLAFDFGAMAGDQAPRDNRSGDHARDAAAGETSDRTSDVASPLPKPLHVSLQSSVQTSLYATGQASPVEDGVAQTFRPSRGRAAVRARTGVLFSRLESLGLRGVEALVLMRTRTVMVSLIGRTLRVHEGYADADEAVLRAIVAFATARTKVARNQARGVILAHDVERAPVPRRVEPARPGDAALLAQLSAAHQELNAKWFHGELSSLALRLSGRMATRLGHFDPGSKFTPPEIVMSRKHVVRHGWREAMHTLLHEMVHQWQHETGQPVDHGTAFRRKCREVGITPAARRDVVPLPRKHARSAG